MGAVVCGIAGRRHTRSATRPAGAACLSRDVDDPGGCAASLAGLGDNRAPARPPGLVADPDCMHVAHVVACQGQLSLGIAMQRMREKRNGGHRSDDADG